MTAMPAMMTVMAAEIRLIRAHAPLAFALALCPSVMTSSSAASGVAASGDALSRIVSVSSASGYSSNDGLDPCLHLKNVEGFGDIIVCAVVETADIAKQDYILTPGRYVGIEDTVQDDEPFEQKMTRLTGELSEMFAKSHDLEKQIKKNLEGLGFKM